MAGLCLLFEQNAHLGSSKCLKSFLPCQSKAYTRESKHRDKSWVIPDRRWLTSRCMRKISQFYNFSHIPLMTNFLILFKEMIAKKCIRPCCPWFTVFHKTVQRKSLMGFSLLRKKCDKVMNYINSCSLAYFSYFLTMTIILSKETRKERDIRYM